MPNVDWKSELDFWLSQLEVLYSNVQGWLEDYILEKQIAVSFKTDFLQEDVLGIYAVRQLAIYIKEQVIKLEPIGTYLVGTKGRVDITGPTGTVRLLLVQKDAQSPRIVYRKRLYESADDEARDKAFFEDKGLNIEADWVWKISTNPPHIHFFELNQESFLDTLLRVIDGH
ncbi:hypothetical protein A0257_04795 [Hymenobacter psoromatis]|nr:hypothetical protein A0257_04795 [Hymenobacter psoromatis]